MSLDGSTRHRIAKLERELVVTPPPADDGPPSVISRDFFDQLTNEGFDALRAMIQELREWVAAADVEVPLPVRLPRVVFAGDGSGLRLVAPASREEAIGLVRLLDGEIRGRRAVEERAARLERRAAEREAAAGPPAGSQPLVMEPALVMELVMEVAEPGPGMVLQPPVVEREEEVDRGSEPDGDPEARVWRSTGRRGQEWMRVFGS